MIDQNPFAALLAGVQRLDLEQPESHMGSAYMRADADGYYVRYAEVLAALAAAVLADLAEAGKVLEGVSEGPWAVDGEDQGAAWGMAWSVHAAENILDVKCDGVDTEANARFIAWCREGVPALIALATAQAAQIAGLQRTYDDLYSDALADAKSDAQDFESDLWAMVRSYLDELHFDWRDFMEDGVTADEALAHIRECMNEETRRAEAAETALAAMTKERDELATANHRQASCIHVTAANLGPDCSATVDGLPKAARHVAAERDALLGAVKGLVEVLDQHETKGPLPDVALMFCWLAAQNVRAALRGNTLEKPE